jgi:hypothetical protein
MVKRVFGNIDGVDISLTRSGDRWEILVPLDSNGEYIIEILAEDEAGNTSYMTKMLFVVNGSMLRQYLIPLPFYAELLYGYSSYLIDDNYTATLQPRNTISIALESRYKAKLI